MTIKDAQDSIKLYEIRNNKKEKYFAKFNELSANQAFFNNDTIEVIFKAGALGGYGLLLEISGEKFSSSLVSYDCTWREDLEVIDEFLKLEEIELIHGNRLKGYYYGLANYNGQFIKKLNQVEIKGSFDMELVDWNQLTQDFEN